MKPLLLGFATLSLVASSRPAGAAAGLSVALAPPVIEKSLPAGGKLSDMVSFTNRGSVPLNVSLELADFAVGADGTVVEAPPATDPSSLVPYLRVSPAEARVGPGEQVFFRYSLEAPADFGQLRAMLYFLAHPDVPRLANQVVVVPRLGVPLYLESTGAPAARLAVESISARRAPDDPARIELYLQVANRGGRNIRPEGFVEVKDERGQVESFPFNAGREPVLPGQQRLWRQAVGPVPRGALSVRVRLTTAVNDSQTATLAIAATGD